MPLYFLTVIAVNSLLPTVFLQSPVLSAFVAALQLFYGVKKLKIWLKHEYFIKHIILKKFYNYHIVNIFSHFFLMCWAAWGWSGDRAGRYSTFCIFVLKLIEVVLKSKITCSWSVPHPCPSSYPDMIIGGWLGKAKVMAVPVGTEGACCANVWLLLVLHCLRYAWWSGTMFHTKSPILENIVKPNCPLPTQTSGAGTTKLDLG